MKSEICLKRSSFLLSTPEKIEKKVRNTVRRGMRDVTAAYAIADALVRQSSDINFLVATMNTLTALISLLYISFSK
jgi:hypothetical protein